jgi:hypothetical protein
MDACRSFILARKECDLKDLTAATGQSAPIAIPYATPANENEPTRLRLSARCRALFSRVIVGHR